MIVRVGNNPYMSKTAQLLHKDTMLEFLFEELERWKKFREEKILKISKGDFANYSDPEKMLHHVKNTYRLDLENPIKRWTISGNRYRCYEFEVDKAGTCKNIRKSTLAKWLEEYTQ